MNPVIIKRLSHVLRNIYLMEQFMVSLLSTKARDHVIL